MGNGILIIPKIFAYLCWFQCDWEKGHREGNSTPRGIFAIVLGRYAVLFSTAPPPLRLSALQNACVCPHSGRYAY